MKRKERTSTSSMFSLRCVSRSLYNRADWDEEGCEPLRHSGGRESTLSRLVHSPPEE